MDELPRNPLIYMQGILDCVPAKLKPLLKCCPEIHVDDAWNDVLCVVGFPYSMYLAPSLAWVFWSLI